MTNVPTDPNGARPQGAAGDSRLFASLCADFDAVAGPDRADRLTLEWVERTVSTNTDLLERARRQAPARPVLLTATIQTGGRGRHGRNWHAEPGDSLLFSLAVPWRRGLSTAAPVTLAVGVVLAEALRGHGVPVQLRWPNDLLLEGRKLAGVLVEIGQDPWGGAALVVGVGVNLHLGASQRQRIGQPAAALSEWLAPEALEGLRGRLLAQLAMACLDAVQTCDREGLDRYRPRFEALFAFAGCPVALLQQGLPVLAGTALGIDEMGRLLLDDGQRVHAVVSGELSLRECEAP